MSGPDWEPGEPLYDPIGHPYARYLVNDRGDAGAPGPAEEVDWAPFGGIAARWPVPMVAHGLDRSDVSAAYDYEARERLRRTGAA